MQNEAEKQSPSIELYGLPEDLYVKTTEILDELFPVEEIKSVQLVLLEDPHYAPWATMRARYPESLREYEPEWSPDELSPGAFLAKLQPQQVYPSWHYAIEVFVSDDTRMLAGCLTVALPRGGTEQAIRISYWLAEPFQGKGIGSEVIEKLVTMVANTGVYRRIEALVCPENIPSQRILEKNGFEREGLLKEPLKINGKWRDHYLYAIVIKEVDKNIEEEQDEGEGDPPSVS